MTERVALYRRKLLLLAAGWMAVAVPSVIAQVSSAPAAKPLAFDVVSIRPSPPNADPYHGGGYGVTPDGYHARITPLEATILVAYFPAPSFQHGDQLKGMPAWVRSERFDIEAKVAPADLAEWQRQKPMVKTSEMMQTMLQNVLVERCKLAVHRIPTEIQGYELVVGKQGPKFKEAKPDEALPPGGMESPDGGTAIGSARGIPLRWTFYGASMESLRFFLSIGGGGSIQDKTGLTGRYDFVLMKREDYAPPAGLQDNTLDPREFWDMDALGLELKPVKVPSENVVIDHIERPSEN